MCVLLLVFAWLFLRPSHFNRRNDLVIIGQDHYTLPAYIHKTIGIQALFDVYRACISRDGLNGAEEKTGGIFEASRVVDFSDSFYQASGKGRVRIKNTLLLYGGLTTTNEIVGTDVPLYGELLRKYPKSATVI
jgi:hypothetical protein